MIRVARRRRRKSPRGERYRQQVQPRPVRDAPASRAAPHALDLARADVAASSRRPSSTHEASDGLLNRDVDLSFPLPPFLQVDVAERSSDARLPFHGEDLRVVVPDRDETSRDVPASTSSGATKTVLRRRHAGAALFERAAKPGPADTGKTSFRSARRTRACTPGCTPPPDSAPGVPADAFAFETSARLCSKRLAPPLLPGSESPACRRDHIATSPRSASASAAAPRAAATGSLARTCGTSCRGLERFPRRRDPSPRKSRVAAAAESTRAETIC